MAMKKVSVQEQHEWKSDIRMPRIRQLDSLPRRQILSCSFDELVETSWEKPS